MNDVTAEKIYGLLAEMYPLPEWVIIPELRGATGWDNLREIDAFAIACWSKPWVGYSIAFEIKVSRQDFKREIADPHKRATFVRNSNQFFFVTLPEVCTADEVPEECGLMHVVANGKMKVMKIAKQKQEIEYASGIVASIARNFAEKDKSYHVSKRKLFKYAGTEMTKDAFEALIENESKEHIKGLDDAAFAKALREVHELCNTEYTQAMKAICGALDLSRLPEKHYSKYYNEKGIYTYERVVELIRDIREKLTKEGSPDSDAKLMRIRAILDEGQGG